MNPEQSDAVCMQWNTHEGHPLAISATCYRAERAQCREGITRVRARAVCVRAQRGSECNVRRGHRAAQSAVRGSVEGSRHSTPCGREPRGSERHVSAAHQDKTRVSLEFGALQAPVIHQRCPSLSPEGFERPTFRIGVLKWRRPNSGQEGCEGDSLQDSPRSSSAAWAACTGACAATGW